MMYSLGHIPCYILLRRSVLCVCLCSGVDGTWQTKHSSCTGLSPGIKQLTIKSDNNYLLSRTCVINYSLHNEAKYTVEKRNFCERMPPCPVVMAMLSPGVLEGDMHRHRNALSNYCFNPGHCGNQSNPTEAGFAGMFL